jgi:hypothetical protein
MRAPTLRGVIRITAQGLSGVKWWVGGAGLVAALIGYFLDGRLAVLFAGSGTTLALVAWALERATERRRAATTWPHRLDPRQRTSLTHVLQAAGPEIVAIHYVRANGDARAFAESLHALLSEVGWLTTVNVLFWTPVSEVVGLELRTTAMFPLSPALAILRRELTMLGFRVTETKDEDSPMTMAILLVGERPS